MECREFNWVEDQQDIVIQRVSATAIYLNQSNDVVFRQQDDIGSDDQVIIIHKQHIPKVIAALKKIQRGGE